MASNLSTIGFSFADEASFQAAMLQCASEAIAGLKCHGGEYRIWRSRSGAELWFHIGPAHNGETEIHGLTPFFEGQSEIALKITGPVNRPGDTAFEGAFYGWVAPDETGEGNYPLVFDAVDYAAQAAASWPAVRKVRISGFARELTAYANDAAYLNASDGDGDPRLAAQSFIPIGLFAAAQADPDAETLAKSSVTPPSSNALLTGRVRDHRLYTNEQTAEPFHWLLVESLDATFDIIADPAVVNGEILAGGTIEVTCLLFGRFLED